MLLSIKITDWPKRILVYNQSTCFHGILLIVFGKVIYLFVFIIVCCDSLCPADVFASCQNSNWWARANMNILMPKHSHTHTHTPTNTHMYTHKVLHVHPSHTHTHTPYMHWFFHILWNIKPTAWRKHLNSIFVSIFFAFVLAATNNS